MSLHVIQNFYKTTVARRWSTTGAGNFYVTTLPTPSSGWLVVSPNNETLREIVYYSATGSDSNGNYITISAAGDRGVGGTTAQTHEVSELVNMNITAEHWDEVSDALDSIVAAGAQDASETTKGITKIVPAPASATSPIALGSNAISSETTSGTTHSLTTVASELVMVWAKGFFQNTNSPARVSLNYNAVEKDFIAPPVSSDDGGFCLMYTETPGAATQNITVTSSNSTIQDVVITVLKIKK